jgi:hypothetical protein
MTNVMLDTELVIVLLPSESIVIVMPLTPTA